jgi:hypothetical protein
MEKMHTLLGRASKKIKTVHNCGLVLISVFVGAAALLLPSFNPLVAELKPALLILFCCLTLKSITINGK